MSQQIINKYQKIGLFSLILAFPIIIYLYFLKWKTPVLYGDDVGIWINCLNLDNFYEKINFPLIYGKYRPIQGIIVSFLIETFQKNLDAYYIFNVLIQTLMTLSFALIINMFLRCPIYSLVISLTLGLSKYTLWNMTQLFNGGALEGTAIIFFLLSLFFVLRTIIANKDDINPAKKQNGIISSIFFANLASYTHERYIVLLPFIILLVVFFPTLKILDWKQKVGLTLMSLFSILINIVIKTYIYSTPFFVGTGGTNISISFTSIFDLFTQGILSIFQINTGPEHQVGIPFSYLPPLHQVLPVVVSVILLLILILYTSMVGRTFTLRIKENYWILYFSKQFYNYNPNFYIFIFLVGLLILLLIPAVMTITLDQRFLQAPFSVFILIVVIAINDLVKKQHFKNLLFLVLTFLILWSDFIYLSKGESKIYFILAQQTATIFKKAVENETIRTNPENLYIWQKTEDVNIQNALKWYLFDGAFFEFYQKKKKRLLYLTPTSEKISIDKNTDQIIYIGRHGIIDLTDFYLQDSIPQSLK